MREPLICKFRCFSFANNPQYWFYFFALSFQVFWAQVSKVLTYLVRTSQSPVGWRSSAGRRPVTWLWVLLSVFCSSRTIKRWGLQYVSPVSLPSITFILWSDEQLFVFAAFSRGNTPHTRIIKTIDCGHFGFLCVQQLSQKPLFVPGVWGPCLSAMVPELWLNEGGQSATGRLVRLPVGWDCARDLHSLQL